MSRLTLGCVLVFAAAWTALAGCAPAPAATLIESRPTVASPVAPKPTGKLSARLEMLAQSPSLRVASADEQARALSLPAQGPGSLMRDEHGRLLVTIGTTDFSDSGLQALRDAGVVITNVSEQYRVVTAFVAPDDLITVVTLPAVHSVVEELTPGGGGGAVFPTP